MLCGSVAFVLFGIGGIFALAHVLLNPSAAWPLGWLWAAAWILTVGYLTGWQAEETDRDSERDAR
jgi:hypothetical protein